MKRKEIIERFKIKDSFLNLMITRATVLKSLKAGMGYANEYDEKAVCLILIGWEMHKLGVSFRYINKLLSVWKQESFEDFKKYIKEDYEFLCILPEKYFAKASKQDQEDWASESWMSKKDLINHIKLCVEPLGMILINVKKIIEKVC